jgi:uncharacterized protein YgfB (UPF0149 family)
MTATRKFIDRKAEHSTVMLEIDDEAVGLLLGDAEGYQFDATDPALRSWHGHVFKSIGEAQHILSRARKRANDQ